jgi:hypothetical protein
MIGNSQEISQWLWNQDREKLFEVKEFKQHRTLSQNAYVWKLINEIANKVNKTKEDVYLQMLKDYGQCEVISMKSNINPNGYFKYYEPIGTGYVNGTEFTHYKIYKGSSEFTTLEMKYLLDGVIQEAENLGIPTLTEEQISNMRLV